MQLLTSSMLDDLHLRHMLPPMILWDSLGQLITLASWTYLCQMCLPLARQVMLKIAVCGQISSYRQQEGRQLALSYTILWEDKVPSFSLKPKQQM